LVGTPSATTTVVGYLNGPVSVRAFPFAALQVAPYAVIMP